MLTARIAGVGVATERGATACGPGATASAAAVPGGVREAAARAVSDAAAGGVGTAGSAGAAFRGDVAAGAGSAVRRARRPYGDAGIGDALRRGAGESPKSTTPRAETDG